MTAATQSPQPDLELRPTREPLRPTRDALGRSSLAPESRRRAHALVVARFPNVALVEPVMASLASRAIDVQRLDPVAMSSIPITVGAAVERTLRRSAICATGFGALGALLGALSVSSEALIPLFGWLPGPLVGAALGAGTAGTLGLVLGALGSLFVPDVAVRADESTVLVVLRARAFDLDALVVRLMEAGGTIVAIGDA